MQKQTTLLKLFYAKPTIYTQKLVMDYSGIDSIGVKARGSGAEAPFTIFQST